MVAKCVGYSILKLYVDEEGLQPLPGVKNKKYYLNSGQFTLPIVYGKIPVEGLLSESSLNALPHITNAFLSVRLFDYDKQDIAYNITEMTLPSPTSHFTDFKRTLSIMSEMSLSELDKSDNSFSKSIACAIVFNSSIASNREIRKLPSSLVREHSVNKKINFSEKQKLHQSISKWMSDAFPRYEEVELLINPKYVLNYDGRIGCSLGLDMLYNMPDRKKLIKEAQQASHVMVMRSGYAKGWDNKIKYFKTVFRYLPGSNENIKPESSDGKESGSKKEKDISCIIDDASVVIDIHSHELSPIFLDKLSTTTGLNLGVNSCVLVQVTAVDILTIKNPEVISKKSAPVDSPPAKPAADCTTTSDKTAIDPFDSRQSNETEKCQVDKEDCLKGLVGVYVASKEFSNSWWGILPLISTDSEESDNSLKTEESNSLVNDVSVSIKKEEPISYFANFGTHAVPLFQGYPPEEITSSSNPLKTLLSRLQSQTTVREKSRPSLFNFPLLCRGKNNEVASTSTSTPRVITAIKIKKKAPLVLSSGASAIVRIVDSRLPRSINKSIGIDSSITPETSHLMKILKSYSTYSLIDTEGNQSFHIDNNKLKKIVPLFSYNALKHAHCRTVKEAIPNNVDEKMLIKRINQKFCETFE